MPNDVRPTTKKAQREASTREILRVALRLFVSQGYRHTTVDQIASAAKLTKGSVYFYFGSKEALLTALLDETEEIVARQMVTRVANAGPAAAEKLVAFVHGQAKLGIERWEHVLLLILMSLEFRGVGDLTEKRIRKIYDELYRAVENIIDQGKADGSFRADVATREQAAIVMAGHDGTFLEWYRRGRRLDGEQLVRALRHATLGGLVRKESFGEISRARRA